MTSPTEEYHCPFYNERRLADVVENALNAPSRKAMLRDAFIEAFDICAERYGFDIRNPLEQQADMLHLRKWRIIVEKSGSKAMMTTITIVMGGVLAAIWLGIQTMLGKGVGGG